MKIGNIKLVLSEHGPLVRLTRLCLGPEIWSSDFCG